LLSVKESKHRRQWRAGSISGARLRAERSAEGGDAGAASAGVPSDSEDGSIPLAPIKEKA